MTIVAKRKLTIYLPDLSGGGAERLHVSLAPAFLEAGLEVTFLLDRHKGQLIEKVPAGCDIVTLHATRPLNALPKLIGYLKTRKPDILIVNMEHMNIVALWARMLARSPTRIIVTQHNALSEQAKRPSWQFRSLPWLYRRFIGMADAIVAVSQGVADDMSAIAGLAKDKVTVIYNGVVTPDFAARAAQKADHPWFATAGGPIVLAVGRLTKQKDYLTLINAFAQSAPSHDARLLILGEGPLRGDLQKLIADYGLQHRVDMPGFTENPLPYMKGARLLVLSSSFEGFGNVLAEALACGTPVISTDCPHGPSEILDGGRYGELVKVGDSQAMAERILRQLDAPFAPDVLRSRGNVFSTATCARAYLTIFDALAARRMDVSKA